MQEQTMFHLVFLSQVILISFYFPRELSSRMTHIFSTYPPPSYPKLYPGPVDSYSRGQRNYRTANFAILAIGLAIFAALVSVAHDTDIGNAIAMGYFPLQILPLFLLDVSTIRVMRKMRVERKDTARTAELAPRGLFDFVSPTLIALALLVYTAFVVFIIYLGQFEFDWFGGYANIVGITITNLLFVGVSLWLMFGKRLDPHMDHIDRMRQIAAQIKVLVLVSIGATVFLAIDITLSAVDQRNYLPVTLSVYFQVVALISFQAYRVDLTNFEVYKENSMVNSG